MYTRITSMLLTFALLGVGVPVRADEPAVPEGMEIQARGPIHEAFADPALPNPVPGPVAPKKPPENIAELPPDQKPEGADVQWIPGYWSWDDERKDFLWVSGVWRKTPEGRQWIPGYWTEGEDSWQWVRGFWAPADRGELPYQPPPPASLDNGPSAPAPDDSSTYVPGTWMYQADRYAWQPGYWQQPRSGYLWVPTRYLWTPSGYVCVAGYWDYSLEDRGLLFAPVAFTQPLWADPGWSYQPSYCVDPTALLASLFVNPSCGGYYYGDYYGAPYLNAGYRPWYAWGSRYHDPLFGYYRGRNRGNAGWYAGLRDGYRARFDGRSARPPRTLAQQNTRMRNTNGMNNNQRMVAPLAGSNVRLTRVTAERGRASAQQARAFHESAANRARLEGGARHGSLSLNRSQGPSHTAPLHPSAPAPRAAAPHAAPTQRAAPHAAPAQHAAPHAAAVQHVAPHAAAAQRVAPVPHAAPHAAPVQHAAPHAAPHAAAVQRAAPVQHAAPHAAPAHRPAPVTHAAPRAAAPVRHATPQHVAPTHRSAPVQHAAPVHRATPHVSRAAPRPAAAHAAPRPAPAHAAPRPAAAHAAPRPAAAHAAPRPAPAHAAPRPAPAPASGTKRR